jgi:O-antigen ligase
VSTPSGRIADPNPQAASAKVEANWRVVLTDRQIDRLALALALCAVPLSIAVTESLLVVAFLARAVRLARRQASACLPRVLWFWLAWAGLEVLSWSLSPDVRAGRNEIRHLLLLAMVFLALPALDQARFQVAVWCGIFLAATVSSAFLIGDFVSRLIYYSRELSVSSDPSLYLRTGGLLNNWMVYGTVEILVFAGLLAFWELFPEKRRAWLPVYGLNALAIVFSMTRMIWVCCLLVLGIDLAWRRSKWAWAVPLVPLAFFVAAPGVLRARLRESIRPDYYSNAERIQMLRVGWKMVRDNPLTGVGAGRVEGLYRHYLSPGEPVPSYHGHLHNNLVQLAAEFGLPVAAAALAFLVGLSNDLHKRWKAAAERETRFLCRTSILGLAGFVAAGLFDYTYGHSLGLILLSFAVLTPLLPAPPESDKSVAQC